MLIQLYYCQKEGIGFNYKMVKAHFEMYRQTLRS